MEATIQAVFAKHFNAWSAGRRLPLHQHKAARALARCRTTAMGTHVQQCPRGHYARVEPNACRSRSCPRCAALARERWVESEQAKLLACDHYHVVFTLPHELLPLFTTHRRLMVDILFRSVRETLMTLLGDERYLGAEPGLLMALHTWGRNLSRHPHIHCLVSGGGLTAEGHWRSTSDGYLLPVRVVKALYRGKFLGALSAALRDGALAPAAGQSYGQMQALIAGLRGKDWRVRLKEHYPHGQGVMKYLARYIKGGPISNSRLLHMDAQTVTFRYQDHRDGRHKRMTLDAGEFIGRLLWHLPEPYQHFVRTAGLYSNRALEKRNRCRAQLKQDREIRREVLSWQAYLTRLGHGRSARCPTCGSPLVTFARRRPDQISYKTRPPPDNHFVQPLDRAEIACLPSPT